MKTILDKLKEDKELDNYYSLSELDSEKFIQEIIDYSISNEKETISFCKGIKPTEFCPLELVYQALSRDWARWGSFLSDEFIRVYNLAYKSIEQDYSDECLLEICPNDDVSDFSIDKIINFLAKEIQSEKLNRQHRSITFLTEWINDENYKKHQSIVQKIIEKSYGPNWKIRVVCFMFLNNLSQVNQEEHKIKFFDKFRTKFPLFFGDSTELIDLNKESSKVNNYKKLRYFNFIMALIFAFYPNQFSAFFIILFSVILLIPIVELIFSASKGKASLVTLIKYPIFDKNESEEIGFTFFDSINFTFILVALKLNRDFDFEKLSDGIIPVLIIVFSLMLVLLKIKQFDKISKNKYKIIGLPI